MNAYELADALQKDGLNNDNHGLFSKRIQNMLRQQADELKACKIHDRRGWEYAEELEQERRKQADRIAKLEYEISFKSWLQTKQSEPVAWMQMHYKDNIPTKFSPVKVWEDDIPLYTTPQTKPLSNEEIIKIFNQIWIDGGNTNGVMHRFARAIEETHGIK